MNALLSFGLLLCACLAYASAMPAEDSPPLELKDVPKETLQGQESAWGGGYGGWGRGWGRGYGGYGRGWGGGYGGWGRGWGGGYGGYGRGWGGGYGWGR